MTCLSDKLNVTYYSIYIIKLDFSYLPVSQLLITHKHNFRYADQVTMGDEVLVHENGQLIHANVIDVSSSVMQGNNHS